MDSDHAIVVMTPPVHISALQQLFLCCCWPKACDRGHGELVTAPNWLLLCIGFCHNKWRPSKDINNVSGDRRKVTKREP